MAVWIVVIRAVVSPDTFSGAGGKIWTCGAERGRQQREGMF